MSSLFEWSDLYSVRIPSIDAEHKQIVQMLNDYYDKPDTEKVNVEEQKKVIAGLIEYVKTHLTEEEGKMLQHKYPLLEEHRDKHTALIKKVMEYKKSVDEGNALSGSELSRFIAKWLRFHIQNEDMKYVGFMIEHGVQ